MLFSCERRVNTLKNQPFTRKSCRNMIFVLIFREQVTAMAELKAPKQRVQSIDLLRGIVIVIMALDHVRDYFHIEGATGDPTNMQTTTPLLFFTRFITHFCAPVF